MAGEEQVAIEDFLAELKEQRDNALELAAMKGALIRKLRGEIEQLREQLKRAEMQLSEATGVATN